jgi:hypothetical protein
MDTTTTAPPSRHALELTRRVRDGGLPGDGVRWDDEAQVWRVRNELTGQWKLTAGGSVEGWRDFQEALAVWRRHQPPVRVFGW